MWRRCLAGYLILGLLFAPCLASSEPLPSSSGVYLSDSELAKIEAEIKAAQEALKKSSETIAQQSKDLTTLSIFCGVLGGALVLEAVASIIVAIKH